MRRTLAIIGSRPVLALGSALLGALLGQADRVELATGLRRTGEVLLQLAAGLGA